MKQFFKFFTASCLGVFAAFILIGLFFAAYLGTMAGKKPIVPKKTVLELDFSAPIPEISGNVSSGGFSFENTEYIGLEKIKQLLKSAATDKNVEGILINSMSVGGGQATVSSIRDALIEFKESDKFIYAYSDVYSQSSYYLASVADSVFLNPQGMVDVKGFASMIPFFKGTFDKLGVEMNIFYAGNFKSATEPFRREEMSEPNKLQTKEFLNEMVEIFKTDIAESRGMTEATMEDILQNYKGRTAEMALESGLIDEIVYRQDVDNSIRKQIDIKEGKKIKYKSLSDYNRAAKIKENSKADDHIAVVFAEGTIVYGQNDKGMISEEKYVKILEKIQHNDDIKAVVLRVNSGGGNSLTSDIIWKAIENVKAAGKPVVASFGDYAASGGYYISAGADKIVSAPNTLTGSIGVFMMFPNLTDMFNEKFGITFDDVRTHPMAVSLTPFKDLSDKEKEFLQASTLDIYDTFLNRVADGRNMSVDAVHEIAQGRVWTGTKAKEIGLVDEIGDLDMAIDLAAELADIEDFSLKQYPSVKETMIEQIIKGIAESEDFSAQLGIDRKDIEMIKHYKDCKALLLDRSPQARLPFILVTD